MNIKHNPVGDRLGNTYVRMRSVAEISKLNTINGALLKKYDRKDCEIFYLRETFREYFALKKVASSLIKNNIIARAEFNKSEDDVSETIVDNLINYETVKLVARENHEYQRLRSLFVSWAKTLWVYANSFILIDIVVGSVGNIGLFAVLFFQ